MVSINCNSLIEEILADQRDIFTPANPETLHEAVEDNGGVLSEFLQAEFFDDIFERTYNVSYFAGDKKQFLKYIKDPDEIN
jgi:hypothetical protein